MSLKRFSMSSQRTRKESGNPLFTKSGKLSDLLGAVIHDFESEDDLLSVLPPWYVDLLDTSKVLNNQDLWMFVMAKYSLKMMLYHSNTWSIKSAVGAVKDGDSMMMEKIQEELGNSRDDGKGGDAVKLMPAVRALTQQFQGLLKSFIDKMERVMEERVALTLKGEHDVHPLRMVKYMDLLELKKDEREVFQCYLFSSTKDFVGGLLPDNVFDYITCHMYCSLCDVPLATVMSFFNKSRKHVKDGTVAGCKYLHQGPENMREEVFSIFCGQSINSDAVVFIQNTTLYTAVKQEIDELDDIADEPEDEPEEDLKPHVSEDDSTSVTSSTEDDAVAVAEEGATPGVQDAQNNGEEDDEDADFVQTSRQGRSNLYEMLQNELIKEGEFTSGNVQDDLKLMNSLDEDEIMKMPYKSDIGYIQDCCLLVSAYIKQSNASRTLEQEGLEVQDDNDNLDMFGYGYGLTMGGGGDNRQEQKRTSERKLRKAEMVVQKLESRVKKRLRLTKKNNDWSPRLIRLAEALNLSKFEQNVVITLIGNEVAPSMIFGDQYNRAVVVRDILNWFSPTIASGIENRGFFYKNATLIKEGVIVVGNDGVNVGQDLTNCFVQLDRRMLDFVVGLETEFSEIMDGSNLYAPTTRLKDVVIPKSTLDLVLGTAKNFDKYRQVAQKLRLEAKYGYGTGMVLLFYGSPGTGKTMLANALAKSLDKKILLINFPQLGSNSAGAIVKMIFREAKVHNAIVFFDECESLFMTRERDPSNQVNTLLTEMERYDGLCILATNRPQELDEAMHRRITLAVEFKKPDHVLRQRIWESLRPSRLKLDASVNIPELAMKYELSGGFIKNAWISAINFAVSRDGTTPKIRQEDLHKGASHQLRGRLTLVDFDRRIVPKHGIDELVISAKVREDLQQIVDFNKSQNILFNQWGFEQKHGTTKGVTALFHGVPGTGKTLAATSIGYDLGKPVKLVNCAQVLSKWVGESGKNIDAVFEEAVKMDAVLVFDECEALFGSRGGDDSRHDTMNVGLLLHHMQAFTGVCILCTNVKSQLDKAFFRRFKFMIEFKMPDQKLRKELWAALIPDKMPVKGKLDLAALARKYQLAGGNIKNCVFRAAMRASLKSTEKDRFVTQKDLEAFAKEEMQKGQGSVMDADSMSMLYT